MKNRIQLETEKLASSIYFIRGEKVIMDFTLAHLYEVEVRTLKRAVRRNIQRFPKDFMFELTKAEYISLRSHFGMLKRGEHAIRVTRDESRLSSHPLDQPNQHPPYPVQHFFLLIYRFEIFKAQRNFQLGFNL